MEDPVPAAEARESIGRVLLVVDDAKRRARHAYLMEALQFECVEAEKVREALAQTEGAEPNLVFIDLADDGQAIETSRRIKRYFDGGVPVLLGLSLNGTPTQGRVAEAGADDYVVHPIDEVELIFKLRTMMAHAKRLQELRQVNDRLDGLLRRHVGGPLVDQWLTRQQETGHEATGREVVATVLFADINGFTRMSSEWPAERTVVMLNEILTLCTLPLVDYGGTVDKYIGDCVMAYFGPADEQPEHATRAVRAALAMQRALGRWTNQAPELAGGVTVSIGVNTGQMVLGNVGSSLRLDHTVIGDPVNVAARLQELAPVGKIFAGPQTVEETAYQFRWNSCGKMDLRGRAGHIEVSELIEEVSRAAQDC